MVTLRLHLAQGRPSGDSSATLSLCFSGQLGQVGRAGASLCVGKLRLRRAETVFVLPAKLKFLRLYTAAKNDARALGTGDNSPYLQQHSGSALLLTESWLDRAGVLMKKCFWYQVC